MDNAIYAGRLRSRSDSIKGVERCHPMNYANNSEREQIIDRALTARTLPEIKAAAQDLRQWLQDHPDDWSAEDALEPLAMLRRGLEAEQKTAVAVGATS